MVQGGPRARKQLCPTHHSAHGELLCCVRASMLAGVTCFLSPACPTQLPGELGLSGDQVHSGVAGVLSRAAGDRLWRCLCPPSVGVVHRKHAAGSGLTHASLGPRRGTGALALQKPELVALLLSGWGQAARLCHRLQVSLARGSVNCPAYAWSRGCSSRALVVGFPRAAC